MEERAAVLDPTRASLRVQNKLVTSGCLPWLVCVCVAWLRVSAVACPAGTGAAIQRSVDAEAVMNTSVACEITANLLGLSDLACDAACKSEVPQRSHASSQTIRRPTRTR